MPARATPAPWMRGASIALVAVALWVDGAQAADDAALARCRAIADNAARLACYDALPLGAPQSAGPAAAPQTAGRGAAPQVQPAQPAPIVIPADQFGFEERIIEKSGLPQIESRIDGKFDGWAPNAIIRLVNGQVWQVTDLTSRFYDLDSPEVEISRGVLSAFYLNIKGDNHTVRVKRVQ